jgi:DNA-binding MarR family transcriptional regulator/protocatechuate 3,4-dioxygenase beta subunit
MRPTAPHASRRSRWSRGIPVLTVLLLAAAPFCSPVLAEAGPGLESINGYVYDEHGQGKEGVLVWCSASSTSYRTESSGRYEITGTSLDGSGQLIFSASGYMNVEYAYTLEDGEAMSLNVYLVEEEVWEAAGSVAGSVLSQEGDVLPGARVSLTDGSSWTRLIDADTHGHFIFDEVPAIRGSYTLSATARGYEEASVQVTVTPDETTWQNLTLDLDVPMEVIRGTVTDSRGLPLPGALVTLKGANGVWPTDLEGNYRIEAENIDGSQTVTASLQGYSQASLVIEVPDRGIEWANLTLKIEGKGGTETLWVQVLEANEGSGVEDATITIEGRPGKWHTDARGITAIIGPDLEGTQVVQAHRDEHTSAEAQVVLEDGGTAVISLAIVRASNAVWLVGHVTDLVSGLPVEDARVTIAVSGLSRTTLTDPQGKYQLYKLPPGVETQVTVSAKGYQQAEVTTVLRELELNRIDVVLKPSPEHKVEVRGTVVDETTHELIAGAQVTLWTMDDTFVARTAEDGSFSVELVTKVGTVLQYFMEHQFYEAYSGSVEVGAASVVLIEAALTPIGPSQTVIRGYVSDPDGFPVPNAKVGLTFPPEQVRETSTDGMYELFSTISSEFMPDMSASAYGYGWHNQTPSIRPHVVNWVNFTLPLGPGIGNIIGMVSVEDSGLPLAGAEVFLSATGAFHEQVLTQEGGAFIFQAVPAMDTPYQLSVVARGYSGATVLAFSEGGRTTFFNLTVHEDVSSTETVQGRIAGPDGRPLAGVAIGIEGHDIVYTDAEGRFSLVDDLLEGNRRFEASAAGFKTLSVRLDIGPGQTLWLNLTLDVSDPSAAVVKGQAISAHDGEPLPDVLVRLKLAGSEAWSFEFRTGEDGSFAFYGVPHSWGRVVLTASLSGYYNDSETLTVVEGGTSEVTFLLQRVEFTAPSEGGMTKQEKATLGVSAGVVALTIAAIAATEVGKVALIGLLLIPLYTKIKREKVMDHFVRGRIFEYISQNPGVNYSAIKKRFNLTNGTVTYHLSMLERQDFIRSKHDGIYKRYFRNGSGAKLSDVEPMSVQLSIAKLVRERPGLTQKEIAKRVGSSKQLVSYHIRRMRDEGLLETRREGRSVKVYPTYRTPE